VPLTLQALDMTSLASFRPLDQQQTLCVTYSKVLNKQLERKRRIVNPNEHNILNNDQCLIKSLVYIKGLVNWGGFN